MPHHTVRCSCWFCTVLSGVINEMRTNHARPCTVEMGAWHSVQRGSLDESGARLENSLRPQGDNLWMPQVRTRVSAARTGPEAANELSGQDRVFRYVSEERLQ